MIDADPPALQQMIDVYEQLDGPVLAVERVPEADVSSYGIVDVDPEESLARRASRARPRGEAAARRRRRRTWRSSAATCSPPTSSRRSRQRRRIARGEIQLTNGLRQLLKSRPIYTCEINGVRHDTGNKLGYLKAMVYFALRRPDLADPFREYLAGLDLTAPVRR